MGEPAECINELMRSTTAKQKHVPQLKRKEQKWNFIQIYNVVLVQLIQWIHFNARTCVSVPLISVVRASSGYQPICQCLDLPHKHAHALARTHWLFCSLLTGRILLYAVPHISHLFSHREWHAIIITSEQVNKYRFRVWKVVSLLGQILFRRIVLASRLRWMRPIQNTNKYKISEKIFLSIPHHYTKP